MGFYERRILPRLIDLAMRQKQLAALRERVVGAGAEAGCSRSASAPAATCPSTGGASTGCSASTPRRGCLPWRGRARPGPPFFPVELREAAAEELPLDDRAVDAVVMTWTLCSVADPDRALAEIRRVLRPGGSAVVRRGVGSRRSRACGTRWQDRLTPLWRRVAGGCHLDRAVESVIARSGLRLGRARSPVIF